MTVQEFIKQLDWDSAIAECTRIIDGKPVKPVKPFAAPHTVADIASAYLYRGIARCFKLDKDGKHTDAIADLSSAINLGTDEQKARCYRAFAYYLDGNYERAIADCKLCNEPAIDELRGEIYMSMSKYQEAAEYFSQSLKRHYEQDHLPSPLLLGKYIDACKRMNSV